jgi:hypothetical protein
MRVPYAANHKFYEILKYWAEGDTNAVPGKISKPNKFRLAYAAFQCQQVA